MTTPAVAGSPDRVVAIVDESPRSRRAVPFALTVGDRLGIPTLLMVAASGNTQRSSIRRQVVAEYPRVQGAADDSMSAMAESALLVSSIRGRKLPGSGRASNRDLLRRQAIVMGRDCRPVADPRLMRIVMPLDGTPELDALVDTAFAWTRSRDVHVHIVAVALSEPDPVRRPAHPTPRQRFSDDPSGHVEHLIASQPTDGIDVRVEVFRDPIGLGSALQRHLRHATDALLLMPTRRARSLRTLIERSTTSTIVRTSPVPVLLVPDQPGR